MKIIRSIRSSVLAAVVATLCITMIGCISQQTIATLTATLGTAAANVASIQGNTELSVKLTTDTNAAVAAVTNWKNGTPADDVIEALTIVEDDLNLIPQAGPYASLIDLAIGTAQTLIALLPSHSAKASPHSRAVYLAHPAPKNSKEFKSQWNAIVSDNPTLEPAKIR